MSYTININEEQRAALLLLLTKHEREISEDDHPLEYWITMLYELPQVEAQYPGVVHGFCL